MAQEVIINVEAKTADAIKNLEVLNNTIEEQKQILVELEKELFRVETAQKQTSKTNLAAQTQLRQEADHLKNSIKDQRLALKELNLQQTHTQKALDSIHYSSQKVSSSFERVAANGGAIAILDALTGGLASRMRDAFEATKLFNFSLKGTKTALIATGVGAFVVALGTIIAYWDDIKEFISGANKELEHQNDLLNEQITAGDTNLELLKLNLQATELRGQSDESILTKIKQQLIVQRAQNQQLLNNLELQLETEKSQARQISGWERIKIFAAGAFSPVAGALETAKAVNSNTEKTAELQAKINEARKKQANIDLQLAQLESNEEKKRLKRVGDRKKDAEDKKAEKEREWQLEQEYAAKRIALIQKEIEEEYNLRLQGEEKIGALRRQFFEKNLGDSEAANLIRSQNERKRIIAEIEESGALEAQKRMAIAEVNKFYDNEELRIKKESTDKQIEIDKKAAEARLQNLNAVGNALSNFASLVGEQTGAGKAAAIASTLISTYQSAQDSYKSLAGIPIVGPALGAAAAAVAVASGLKQIQAIKSVKVPKERGASSAATPSASTITTATTQAPQFNIIGGGAQNQLAGLLADQTQKPVKAYVVSNEVSTAQSLDRNIVESATLG